MGSARKHKAGRTRLACENDTGKVQDKLPALTTVAMYCRVWFSNLAPKRQNAVLDPSIVAWNGFVRQHVLFQESQLVWAV